MNWFETLPAVAVMIADEAVLVDAGIARRIYLIERLERMGREIFRHAISPDAGSQIFDGFITSVLDRMATYYADESEAISFAAKNAAPRFRVVDGGKPNG